MRIRIGALAAVLVGGGLLALRAWAVTGPGTAGADAAERAGSVAQRDAEVSAGGGDEAPRERIGARPQEKKAAETPLPPGVRVAVLSSLAKVRPGDPAKGAASIVLRALRGECEAAQVAVRAGDAPLAVTPALEGSLGDGARLRLYRVELVQLLRPSGPEGGAGLWPDPLVPEVDPWAGEKRNAFPLPVPAGETRALLVEICVDAGTKPGRRTAALRLAIGEAIHRVPVELRIERAAIPATASLPTTFGFSSRRAALGHHGRPGTEEEIRALDALYRKALLRQRISAHGGTFDPPPFRRVDGRIEVDFTAYDREVGPFLSGEALENGARATTVELRTHPRLASDEERIAYWRAIAEHHRKKGWKALLFDYAHDEPKREELPRIRERALLVKKADPSIRVLLTASLDPKLVGPIDLWTPNLNCLFVKRSPDEWCAWRAPLAAYREAQKQGALLWWYQSCSSHGCDDASIVGAKDDAAASYFRGWPSYVIDAAGPRARAMGWLAFAEGIGGELYWDTVFAYAPGGTPGDPWKPGGAWAFGGNGDGTFFYPGMPARIGGTSHVPIDSLRLHQVRDGLEDYELLRLVAERPGGRKVAERAARRVAPRPWQVTDDPAVVAEARSLLLDFLARQRG